LWFQKVVVPHCSGEVCLIRYADDFVRREARFVYDAKVHLPLVVERQVYPPNLWAEQLAGQG
jgi:hypothetical protein